MATTETVTVDTTDVDRNTAESSPAESIECDDTSNNNENNAIINTLDSTIPYQDEQYLTEEGSIPALSMDVILPVELDDEEFFEASDSVAQNVEPNPCPQRENPPPTSPALEADVHDNNGSNNANNDNKVEKDNVGNNHHVQDSDDDTSKPITKQEMLDIMQQFNVQLVKRDEETKDVIIGLQTEVKMLKEQLAELRSVSKRLEDHIFHTKEQLSTVDADALKLEEQFNKLERQIFAVDPQTKVATIRFPSRQSFDRLVSRVQTLEQQKPHTPSFTTPPEVNG